MRISYCSSDVCSSDLLARALLESGERLVFVKWHTELDRLVLVTQSELEHLSLWGGPELSAEEINIAGYPSAADSAIVIEGDDIHDRNWLVVPEVSQDRKSTRLNSSH